MNIKHDISVAVSRIPEFVRTAEAQIEHSFPGARLVNYGHLGDGNLHYNVQAPQGADAKAFLKAYEAAINTLVYDFVERVNIGRTRHRQPQARQTGALQISGGAATDARHQNRAGPAPCDESGAGDSGLAAVCQQGFCDHRGECDCERCARCQTGFNLQYASDLFAQIAYQLKSQ